MSLRSVLTSCAVVATLAGCSKPARTDDLTYRLTVPSAFVGSTFVLGGKSEVTSPSSGDGVGLITVPRKGPLIGGSAMLRVPTPCGLKDVSLAIRPDLEEYNRQALDVVQFRPKNEDLPRTVTIYVDGAPKVLRVGDADVVLTSAGPKGGMKGALADPECRKDAPVLVDGALVGTLPAFPPPGRAGWPIDVVVLASKDACYSFEEVFYGSGAPPNKPTLLQSPSVHALADGLDYFFDVAPMRVGATRSESTKMLTMLNTTPCPPSAPVAKRSRK